MRAKLLDFGAIVAVALFLLVAELVVPCWAEIVQAVKVTDISPDFSFGAKNKNLDGRIQIVLVDPTNDSTLYAAALFTGVWKSVDGGHTWNQASRGLRNGLTSKSADPGLAIDASNAQRLLYASESKDGRPNSPFGGLWVSTDGATSWRHIELCSTQQSVDNVASVSLLIRAAIRRHRLRPMDDTRCHPFVQLDHARLSAEHFSERSDPCGFGIR